jgi:hypothetical protein
MAACSAGGSLEAESHPIGSALSEMPARIMAGRQSAVFFIVVFSVK